MSKDATAPSSAEYEVIAFACGQWRLVRSSDRSLAARDSGGRDGPVVREWRRRESAVQFVDRLVKCQPVATVHLVWIDQEKEPGDAVCVAPRASEGTSSLAGLWQTDFYRGGVSDAA